MPAPAVPVMRAAIVRVVPAAGLMLAKSVVDVPLRETVMSPSPPRMKSVLAVKMSPPLFERASVAPEAIVTVAGALTKSVFSVMLAGIVTVAAVLRVAVSPAVCGTPSDQLAASAHDPAAPPIHVAFTAETPRTTVKHKRAAEHKLRTYRLVICVSLRRVGFKMGQQCAKEHHSNLTSYWLMGARPKWKITYKHASQP